MSYITHFEIDDLAGRGPCAQQLREDINVFFGPNGCGKTSLLRILHAALANTDRGLDAVPFNRAVVGVYSARLQTNFVRTFDKSKVKNSVIRRERDGRIVRTHEGGDWTTEPADLEADHSWAHTYLPTSRLLRNLLPSSRSDDVESVDRDIDETFERVLTRLWLDYSAEISKKVQAAQERGLLNLALDLLSRAAPPELPSMPFDEAYDRVSHFVERQSNTISLESRDDLRKRYMEDVQLRSVIDNLSAVEQRVEAAVAPRTNLQALLNRLFLNKRVEFGFHRIDFRSSSEGAIRASALSSGEKQLLRLMIETLSAHHNPTIIDEPELSLHIDWQTELLADLRQLKPQSQLIVATHSPEIMADIPDHCIYRL